MEMFVYATIVAGAILCAMIVNRARQRVEIEDSVRRTVVRLAHYTSR